MQVEPDGRRCALRLDEHDLDVLLARADDIPVLLDDRAVDVGIAGENQVVESGVDVEPLLRARLRPLPAGAGGARPAAPCARLADLRGAARRDLVPRAPRRAYLRGARRRRRTLIAISGSVELAPSLGAAEAVADLVSSGETLRQNGLVELETILESQAVLMARARPRRRRSRSASSTCASASTPCSPRGPSAT